MMTRKQLQSQSGTSFVEALIAACILLLVLGSVLGIMSQSYRYLANIRLTARSSQILQQKMEDVRLLSWGSLQTISSTFSDPNDTNHIYTGTTALSDYDSYSGTTTIKRVTLSVTWTNRNSLVATNRLTTLIANGGLSRYIY